MDLNELSNFVVAAKRATYVGGGAPAAASRIGARDLTFEQGDWHYRDSYFGGADFIGQEVVWLRGEPRWAMNYYGYILQSQLIDAARAGATIKAALSAMYEQGRFLGGFSWSGPHGEYRDSSTGALDRFHGREVILVDGVEAYCLDYAGGLIKP